MLENKATFAEFYVLWDQYLKRETPIFHIEVCEWMQELSTVDDNLLMLPRGHNKSGIVTVFNAWRFYCDVDDLLLHQGANNIDSLKCSRAVARILSNHPLCVSADIKKDRGGVIKWWVKGSSDEQYGSMYARGILSSVTGQRAMHIQNDDVEVQKNVATQENREKLKHSLTEQTHILIPGGSTLFIGTPHSHDSIYKEMIDSGARCFIRRMFSHEHRLEDRSEALIDFYPEYVFCGIHKGARLLVENKDYTIKKQGGAYQVTILENHHVIDLYANALWPERFNRTEMEKRRRKCRTLNEWDSQYQLHAKPVGDVRLDPDKLIPYDVEPILKRANGQYYMMLGERRIVGITCRWDPASGKKKSDASSVALVLHDDLGNKYWHRSIELTGEVIKTSEDGVIEGGQVWQLCDLIEQYHVPKVVIESNGIGEFAPSSLKGALKARKLRCGVEAKHSVKSKNVRILEAIEGPLVSGLMWAHISVLDSEQGENTSRQYKQMQQFNPAITEQEDDHLDSLAGAVVESPERIGKLHRQTEANPSVNWRENSGSIEAALDFEH